MIDHVVFGVVEESVMLQQRILERRALDGIDLHIRSNSAAAVHGASAVGELDLAVSRALAVFVGTLEIIVVERDVRIVALNQASAGRVVVSGGQSQASIFGERINGLHQAFAKSGFADNQPAIMILNRASHDFRRRSRAAVNQNH